MKVRLHQLDISINDYHGQPVDTGQAVASAGFIHLATDQKSVEGQIVDSICLSLNKSQSQDIFDFVASARMRELEQAKIKENPDMSESQAMLQAERDAEAREEEDAD
jgi:hypothetical protein